MQYKTVAYLNVDIGVSGMLKVSSIFKCWKFHPFLKCIQRDTFKDTGEARRMMKKLVTEM